MQEQEAIKRLELLKEWGWKNETLEVIDKAVEALEKQMPKKVVDKIHKPNGFYGKCPICNCNNTRMNYCQRCGQKLDWSADNEEH